MTGSAEEQKFSQLVQIIAPQCRLLRTWPLKGGISAEMTALELEHPDGATDRMIVRYPGAGARQHNPQAATDEFRLLQLLHALGLATPRPVYLDPSGKIFPAPYLVIEYIEGQPEFAPLNMSDFTLHLATHLARIHSVDSSTLDLSFLPTPAMECDESLSGRPTMGDQSFAEERIRHLLASAGPGPQRNAPVLLHGDYWPGNILWREDRLVAVIDWEDARLGDPLADLAISRLDMLWIFGVEAMHAFTRHYQSMMAIDYSALPYWDLCAALRLVRLAGADLAAWAAFYPPFGRHDITEQTIREHYRFFVTQAFEKLAGCDAPAVWRATPPPTRAAPGSGQPARPDPG